MKLRLLLTILFSLSLTLSVSAQDTPSAPPSDQPPTHGGGGWQGQRGGRGGWGGGGFAGNGILGTVTVVAADHYIIKTGTGESYTIHFSVNTRILKQTIQRHGEGGEGGGPQPLKPAEIKIGDAVGVMGEVDAPAKSVGAAVILQLDPERARQMRQMEADYGKSWLLGKVTAIDETRVTLLGSMDNAAHTFVADENTSFRKHREPVTLADVQVGEMVRVEGALKDGVFVAASVTVRETPPGETPSLPRKSPPQPR